MPLGSGHGIVWLGQKATSNLAFCSRKSTAGVSDDRLRMGRGLFLGYRSGWTKRQAVTGGQRLCLCEVWVDGSNKEPVRVQLNSSPAVGTSCFGLIAPLWEMGLMPRSHFLDGEST